MTKAQEFKAQILDALGRAFGQDGMLVFCAFEADNTMERIVEELRIPLRVVSKAIETAAGVQLH